MQHPSTEPENLRRALANFATGITVVALRDAEGIARGLTVNSFASVSLTPPLVSWCLGDASDMRTHFEAATHFTVNILSAQQGAIATAMACAGQHEMSGFATQAGSNGGVIISDCLAAFECRVAERIAAGDHMIYLGAVEMVHRFAEAPPLLYFRGVYGDMP